MSITVEMKLAAEEQIKDKRKEIDYDTRDYSIEYLMDKFREGEFYIPDKYQRQYIWDDSRKIRLIESIILGLPIPFMFFSDVEDGRCEIIDGAQRTQALEEFTSNELVLKDLKKLSNLDGFKYEDIPEYFQKKFVKTNLRVIILSDETTIDIRQEIFNRINTGGDKANPIEVRRGSYIGPFMDFIKDCSKNTLFEKICPVSDITKKRYEDLELVLRFFAFLNNYQNFTHRVDSFLDDYVDENQNSFEQDAFKVEFENMLEFVQKYFPNGCRKTPKAKSTPRVRFEAIAVGVGLALREKPDLVPVSMDWLESSEFEFHTTTHASNLPTRVAGRIEYVRDCLLAGDNDADDN